MQPKPLWATPNPQPTPCCNHTLYHVDRAGRPDGSWISNGHVVICRGCKKFYGRLQESPNQKTGKSAK